MKYNPILGMLVREPQTQSKYAHLRLILARTQDAREVKKLKDLIEELQVEFIFVLEITRKG